MLDGGVVLVRVVVVVVLVGGARAKIFSTAFSAAIIIGAEGLVVTWPGKMEASTTNWRIISFRIQYGWGIS